ncbi:unnamed protein product [Tetraodon nigroviridis]|uniref:(spotted green pufferfish) hypothetical protein n=1 Tax=Tetraodon nigroviridis TaxID=99883 RepID=Q4SBB7_TETNG|nr:unnamed protein product [Tetraodon nigroviridis]
MESGPTSTPTYPNAQAWLDHHSRSLGLFINGKFVLPADRQSCSLTDSSGSVICSTVCAEDDDISQCASSAADGYQVWSELTCRQRADVLLRLVGIVGQHGQCVSELCGLCGASCSPSTVVRLLQYYGSWAQLRDAFIGGWKPLGEVWWRSSSLMTALFILYFSKSYQHWPWNGALLCEAAAGWGIPVSVSVCVGSSCPFIVFDTADIDSAVDGLIEAAFRTKTDVHWVLCVQERVVESVLARLRLRMAGLKCLALSGDEDRLLVDAAVQEAQQQGATLIQSCTPPSSGAQYPPTVLCKSAPSSPFVVSPPPGPLLPLLAFRSSNEAVALGNHTPHGQAASIWTEDLTLALETAKSAPKHYLQFVGGKPCKSVSGGSVAVEAPGGGGVLGYCPEGGRKDVRNAVEAASKVQPGWMKKSPSARAQSLNSLAKGLDARRRDLAASVSAQTGVSLDEAEKEVELSIVRLGDWAAYCDKLKGGSLPMPQSGFAISVPEAVGVVGVLLPDNNPLYSLVLQACDLPAGLVSILTGRRDQLTAALANHSVIKALWYWGSPEGCQYLQHTCTSPLKTLCLFSQKNEEEADWTHPSIMEEMWRNAVEWKSIWIPTA